MGFENFLAVAVNPAEAPIETLQGIEEAHQSIMDFVQATWVSNFGAVIGVTGVVTVAGAAFLTWLRGLPPKGYVKAKGSED